MLWKKTLKELRHTVDCCIDQNEDIAKNMVEMQIDINKLKELQELQEKVKKLEEYKDALIVALQNDRKDINILIQMVKNKTKGKK